MAEYRSSPQADYWEAQIKMLKPCLPCVYYNETHKCCDYLSIVGHCRPCPPSYECTVRTMKKKGRINYKEMRKMYDKGMSDSEIRKAIGCAESTVRAWRLGEGLSPNTGGSK